MARFVRQAVTHEETVSQAVFHSVGLLGAANAFEKGIRMRAMRSWSEGQLPTLLLMLGFMSLLAEHYHCLEAEVGMQIPEILEGVGEAVLTSKYQNFTCDVWKLSQQYRRSFNASAEAEDRFLPVDVTCEPYFGIPLPMVPYCPSTPAKLRHGRGGNLSSGDMFGGVT